MTLVMFTSTYCERVIECGNFRLYIPSNFIHELFMMVEERLKCNFNSQILG